MKPIQKENKTYKQPQSNYKLNKKESKNTKNLINTKQTIL